MTGPIVETGWAAALLLAAGAMAVKVFDFILARRHTSGTVDTTDAAELWKEAADLREYFVRELQALRAEQVRLIKENEDLRVTNALLHSELAKLQTRNNLLEKNVESLRTQLSEAAKTAG